MAGMEVVIEKLIKMREYIEQLGKIKPNTFDEYIRNLISKYAVERLIQLVVDLALDINNILLAYVKEPPAPDYYNSFIDLSECNVLERSFAFSIAPSTGLRNRLVHEYERINDEVIYKSIDKIIDMYNSYMATVNEFIKGK